MKRWPRLSPDEIKKHKSDIDLMDHITMAKFRRFASAGHIYFREELCVHFENRFQNFGGMTKEVSELIGWEDIEKLAIETADKIAGRKR